MIGGTENIYIEFIDVGQRLRPLDESAVARLMDSMREIGLQTPITVRGLGEDFQDIKLVAGRHRLEAAKRLGWEEIECHIVNGMADDDARMWEIAENLARAELTVAERADQQAEWIRLKEAKLNSRQIGAKSKSEKNPRGAGRPESGIKAAARQLGISEGEARRALKVASLTPEAKEAAVKTGLDNHQGALLEAASAEPERQAAVIHSIADRRAAEEARKEAEKHNGNINRVISLTEAEQFAEWIMARSDLSEMPMLISWLEGTKPKDVIAAMRRRAA